MISVSSFSAGTSTESTMMCGYEASVIKIANQNRHKTTRNAISINNLIKTTSNYQNAQVFFCEEKDDQAFEKLHEMHGVQPSSPSLSYQHQEHNACDYFINSTWSKINNIILRMCQPFQDGCHRFIEHFEGFVSFWLLGGCFDFAEWRALLWVNFGRPLTAAMSKTYSLGQTEAERYWKTSIRLLSSASNKICFFYSQRRVCIWHSTEA